MKKEELKARIGESGIKYFLQSIDSYADHEESEEYAEMYRAFYEYLLEEFPECDPYKRE